MMGITFDKVTEIKLNSNLTLPSAVLQFKTNPSSIGLLKNSKLVALSGVEAPNPERMTGFPAVGGTHPDADGI